MGVRTELGDEEEEHDEGGSERDEAAGEGAAVEVLVHLGVGVQAPELGQEAVHGRGISALPPDDDAAGRTCLTNRESGFGKECPGLSSNFSGSDPG